MNIYLLIMLATVGIVCANQCPVSEIVLRCDRQGPNNCSNVKQADGSSYFQCIWITNDLGCLMGPQCYLSCMDTSNGYGRTKGPNGKLCQDFSNPTTCPNCWGKDYCNSHYINNNNNVDIICAWTSNACYEGPTCWSK